jgi:hypothetical protein
MRVHKLRIESRAVRRRPHLIVGDLMIDGLSLYDQVDRVAGPFDLVSPIGLLSASDLREWAARLVANGRPLLPSGRCELFVCPECGDLGCGCISCLVHRDGDYVVWTELGRENDYDPDGLVLFPMGGFRFAVDNLTGALGI